MKNMYKYSISEQDEEIDDVVSLRDLDVTVSGNGSFKEHISKVVTKTSSASWITEIRCQPYFLNTFTLVGLCTVAEGWVRNKVGNLSLLESAGLDAP